MIASVEQAGPAPRPEEVPAPALPGQALLERLREGPLNSDEAAELAQALRRMGEAPSRQTADLLLEAISRRELRLYRHRGTTLHTLAVEALLELGHPYALEMPPEALEEANEEREEQALRAEFPWAGLGVFSIASLIPMVSMLFASWGDPSFDVEALINVVMTVVVGLIASVPALNRRKTSTRSAGITLTSLLGLAELGIGYLASHGGDRSLVWVAVWGTAGVLHLLSALLFMKVEREDPPREEG